MRLKDINIAFEHYRGMYDIMQKFDRPMNPILIYLVILLILLFNFFRLHSLMNYLLNKDRAIRTESDFLGFVFTKNHESVLKSIRTYGVDFPAIYIGVVRPAQNSDDVFISDKRLFLEALTIPNLGKLLFKSQKDPILKRNFVRVFKLIGCYNVYNKHLKMTKAMISFNDHIPYCTLLEKIAREKKVKTVYIQHASVSEKFPPLYHEYNILFSQDSRDKYKVQPGVKVNVLFDPRFSNLCSKIYESTARQRTILLCTNLLDDINRVAEFISKIKDSYEVTLRPHPRDKRDEWRRLDCKISRNDSVWRDIEENNIIVVNESAVVLEAIYCHRYLFKAAFFSEPIDNYGFLSKKLLLRQYHTVDSLVEAIKLKQKDYDIEKLNYFIGDLSDAKDRVHQVFNAIIST